MAFLRGFIQNCALKARLYYSYSRLYVSRFRRKARRKFRLLRYKTQIINSGRRRRQRRAGAHIENAILPSLPGVSKLKLPEPPVPRLLVSNDLPTEDEVAVVKSVLEEVEEERDRMKKRLVLRMMSGESNRTWEAATRHKIGRASTFIRVHKGCVSILRSLPVEILQEIFIHATFGDSKRGRNSRDVPWQVSQVCQRWRTSAMSLSRLWNNLPTIVLKKGRTKIARQTALIAESIRRSGTAPLHFYVYTRKYNQSTHPVLDLLMRHSEQWHSAMFQLPHSMLPSLRAVKDRLPLLEGLVIRARIAVEQEPTPLDMFAVAPRLQTVTFSGFSLSSRVVLPFSQLVNYTDRSSGTELLLQILEPSNCISLESLTILEISEDFPFPSFTLPKLTKLTVREYNWQNVSYFSNLVLPAIEEIKFMSYGGQVLQTLISLLSNHTESPSPLKSLTFRYEASGAQDAGIFTQLLRLTPNLTHLDASLPPHLDLCNLAFGPEGVDGQSQKGQLVPHLQTCKFYVSADWNFAEPEAESLNSFAAARCEKESSLAADKLPLLPCETRALKTLILYCDFSNGMSMVKQSLNIGPRNLDDDNKDWEELMTIKSRLREEIPDLMYIRQYKGRGWNILWKERVGRILDDLEKLELRNPQLLYHSEFHLILKHMQDWGTKNNENSIFIIRAKDIMDKWAPILEDSLIPNLKWVSKGSHGILYVARDDPLRKADNAKDIVYGLPELDFADIYWPTYMSWDPSVELLDHW